MSGNEKIRPNIMFRCHIQMDFTLLKIKIKFTIYFYFTAIGTKIKQRRTHDEIFSLLRLCRLAFTFKNKYI